MKTHFILNDRKKERARGFIPFKKGSIIFIENGRRYIKPPLTPSITPSVSITSTVTPTPSETPSITPSSTLSVTPSITPSITLSETPSITPSITPNETPSITLSVTPSETPSITPSETPSITLSETPSITPSETPSITPSITLSETPSITPSETLSVTPSETPSITPSETPSITPSETLSVTPSITPSITLSETPSVTPSITPSITTSVTPSITRTPSITTSITPSITRTPSITPTPSPSIALVSSGLIMNWDIQNASSYNGVGSTITDLQGNINGTMTGVISYTNASPKYLTIDGGVSEYIYTANINPRLSPVNTGTIQSTFLWIYPTSNGVIYSEQGQLTPNTGWHDAQIQRDSSDRFLFGVWPYTFNGPAPITSGVFALNNWYYVGWTYSGTTLTAYVNGVSVGTSTYARQTPYNNGGNLPMYFNFGYPDSTDLTTTTSACSYRLGAAQIYNISLTSGQVLQNFNVDKSKYGL